MVDWGKGKKREMFRKVNEQRILLQAAYSSKHFSLLHEIAGIGRRLNRALEDEEKYWKQRSRENWLKWEDKNIKWFHKKVTMRRQRNTICGINDYGGNWVEKPEKVRDFFIDYFTELFQSFNQDGCDIAEAAAHTPTSMTQEMNDNLIAPFSKVDV